MTQRLTTLQKLVNAQHRATARRQAAEAALEAAGQTLARNWGSPLAKAVSKASEAEMAAVLAAFDARNAS